MDERRSIWNATYAFALGAATLTPCLLASPRVATADDDVPSAAALLERVRAAEGTPLASYREVTDATSEGLSVRSVSLHAGSDYVTTRDEGPFHLASGSYHGHRWRQNANGETIPLEPDPGLVAPESYGAVVTRISKPVDGYLVSSLNARGYGTLRYVEAGTWHVVRRDVIGATGTRVTTYDDFRTVAGYTVPFHWTVTDGHPEDDAEFRETELIPLTVTEAELAIPKSRRALVEFPAGTTSISLPVSEKHEKFVVRVNVGTRGLDMLLDTGASSIVLERGVVRGLGLTEIGAVSNAANAGRFRQSYAIVPEMDVGALKMHDVVVTVVPDLPNPDLTGDYRVVGLLGFDFIDAVALKLDYLNEAVTAYDAATFVTPAVGRGFDLPLRLGNGTPMTSITINGEVGERFALDTGASGALLVFDYFQRRHPAALADEANGSLGNRYMMGVGGAFEVRPARIASITFGGVNFNDFDIFETTSRSSYGGDADGLIGEGFLRLFDVYLDYQRERARFTFNDLDQPSPSPSASPRA
jgi:predicted aspartyl protease